MVYETVKHTGSKIFDEIEVRLESGWLSRSDLHIRTHTNMSVLVFGVIGKNEKRVACLLFSRRCNLAPPSVGVRLIVGGAFFPYTILLCLTRLPLPPTTFFSTQVDVCALAVRVFFVLLIVVEKTRAKKIVAFSFFSQLDVENKCRKFSSDSSFRRFFSFS